MPLWLSTQDSLQCSVLSREGPQWLIHAPLPRTEDPKVLTSLSPRKVQDTRLALTLTCQLETFTPPSLSGGLCPMPGLLTQLAEGGHQVQLVFEMQLRQLDLGGLSRSKGSAKCPGQVGQHLGHSSAGGHQDHPAHVVLKGEMSHLQTGKETP